MDNTKKQSVTNAKTNGFTWPYTRKFVIGSIVALFAAILAITLTVLLSKDAEQSNGISSPSRCGTKHIQITHICNLPDLDDDVFGRDTSMDIKVLIQDELYWPQDVTIDCRDGKFYRGSCVIPDTDLMGEQCYALNNSIKMPFDRPILSGDALKVTIHDVDIGADESIDILVPYTEWYEEDECEDRYLNATSSTGSAFVKMVITSESPVSSSPTSAPSLDSSTPILPLRTPSPTTDVTSTPTSVQSLSSLACGINLTSIGPGLSQASTEIDEMQRVLQEYSDLDPRNDGRKLLWGALVRGVTAFTNSFVFRKAGDQGPISTIADFCTIGSTLFAAFGPGDESDPNQEALFEQVFERFDQIDDRLNDIEAQLQDGFEAIQLVVQEEFAKQELDEWINTHLAILDDDYRAYLNPAHSVPTRPVYEDIFRNSCQKDHSPFTILKALYSHSCSECDKLDGRSNQYVLDTFVKLANANFADVSQRIRWFRQSYAKVIVGAMVKATYLHSVCLYQPEDVCQNQDPVWLSRLEEMGEAIKEVAVSLSAAEERLKCYNKKVRITHLCGLQDQHCFLPWHDNSDKDPSKMNLSVEINDKSYWPADVGRDCPMGSIYSPCNSPSSCSCIVPDSAAVNKCYSLKNSKPQLYTTPRSLDVYIGDDCYWAMYTKTRITVPASTWYGDEFECGTRTIQPSSDNGSVKMEIESIPRG